MFLELGDVVDPADLFADLARDYEVVSEILARELLQCRTIVQIREYLRLQIFHLLNPNPKLRRILPIELLHLEILLQTFLLRLDIKINEDPLGQLGELLREENY